MHRHLSENLQFSIRTKLYSSIVKKNLSWFNNGERAPGILSSCILEDVTALNGLTSETLNNILEATYCLLIGIGLAAIFSWKMAVIALVTSPFVIIGGVAL